MDKQKITEFFDRCAPTWDAEMIRSDELIDIILTGAEVSAGKRVLDVACGTGVLIPDYLSRDVAEITGIDISPEMVKLASEKFREEERVHILCGDAETANLPGNYDCVMIYNAFPHFPDPKAVIERLAALTAPGGTLTVAHGMSREALDRHHSGSACEVSLRLMDEDSLAALFPPEMEITVKISDDRMYQVTGKRPL